MIRDRKAHCADGALFGAAALRRLGHRPLLLNLLPNHRDDEHLVALFRVDGLWGAVSKSNFSGLRFREPVYRTLRELAMSYFHEYFNRHGRKTLRSYSVPYDMRRLGPEVWITNPKSCWDTHDLLRDLRHYTLVTRRQEKLLARRDPFERRMGKVLQYPPPKKERKR